MLDLNSQKRTLLRRKLDNELEAYLAHTAKLKVSPELDAHTIRQYVSKLITSAGTDPERALDHVLEGLKQYTVHTPHPRYFGLFNPRASFAGILADTITATFNPQMAAWSHAPFAVEVENYLIKAFGQRLGYPENSVDGCFCSGGAEANLTALVCALNQQFPKFKEQGVRSIPGQAVVYVSGESHHSINKAVSTVGLGTAAVKSIPTIDEKMDTKALAVALEQDQQAGRSPLMIVATMGTTGAGAIDPVFEIKQLADCYGCWLHADAAYGGAVAFHPEYQKLLRGIEAADSITFDAHKWLSVPMGAGMFMTRHKNILRKSFGLKTDYMPKEAAELAVQDPFTHSLQWSRRFIGLKLYLSLLFYGWEGLADLVSRQINLANRLREKLVDSGWKIYNKSALPIVCFGQPDFETNPKLAQAYGQQMVASGEAWLSTYPIANINTLRACVTNYLSSHEDVDHLIALLNKIKPSI